MEARPRPAVGGLIRLTAACVLAAGFWWLLALFQPAIPAWQVCAIPAAATGAAIGWRNPARSRAILASALLAAATTGMGEGLLLDAQLRREYSASAQRTIDPRSELFAAILAREEGQVGSTTPRGERASLPAPVRFRVIARSLAARTPSVLGAILLSVFAGVQAGRMAAVSPPGLSDTRTPPAKTEPPKK